MTTKIKVSVKKHKELDTILRRYIYKNIYYCISEQLDYDSKGIILRSTLISKETFYSRSEANKRKYQLTKFF